ncbi:MAG: carbohydrate kinase family protein [Chloroflexota bacterium]|nr:carbohydrate kinase family protein [Chloroflexota bacterium]
MTKRLVTVGDLVVDLLLDVRLPVTAEDHQMSPTLLLEPGGACSTILAARNLGLDVAALGAVGADFQGRMLLDIMGEAGVDTSALLTSAGSTTTTVVALADQAGGGHVFLGNYGKGPDIALTEAAHEQLQRADTVFISGYSLVEERLCPLVDGVLEFVNDSPTALYVDVGPFMSQLPRERVERVLGLTDVLLLTEDEIPFVSAGETGIKACRRLLERYPSLLIVLKLGESGCRIMTSEIDRHCPGFPVAVVDTIGAGDAYAAAFIWSRAQGYALADCGTIANAMGAASVTKAGAGRGAPTCSEIQALLDKHQTGLQLSC